MTLNEVNQFRFKNGNKGIYTSAYIYDGEDPYTAKILGDFYLDFDKDLSGEDHESVFNQIRADAVSAIRYMTNVLDIKSQYINVFFSGGKGVHITVPYQALGVQPSENLHRIYKLMAEDISKFAKNGSIDLKIYDKRRLFRLVNSRHNKTNLYKIPLTIEELITMPLEDIRELAKDPRVIDRPKTINTSPRTLTAFNGFVKKFKEELAKKQAMNDRISSEPLKITPPCVKELLENPVQKGQRNNTAAALLSFFKQQGISQEEATSRISSWNISYCSPPIEAKEIETTVNSIYNREYTFGCSSMKTLATCNQDKCELVHR
jgi:DNA primase large subunit